MDWIYVGNKWISWSMILVSIAFIQSLDLTIANSTDVKTKPTAPKTTLHFLEVDTTPKTKRETNKKTVLFPVQHRVNGTKVVRKSKIRKKLHRRFSKYRHSTRVIRGRPAIVLLPPFYRRPMVQNFTVRPQAMMEHPVTVPLDPIEMPTPRSEPLMLSAVPQQNSSPRNVPLFSQQTFIPTQTPRQTFVEVSTVSNYVTSATLPSVEFEHTNNLQDRLSVGLRAPEYADNGFTLMTYNNSDDIMYDQPPSSPVQYLLPPIWPEFNNGPALEVENQLRNNYPTGSDNQIRNDYPTAVDNNQQVKDYPSGSDSHIRNDYPSGPQNIHQTNNNIEQNQRYTSLKSQVNNNNNNDAQIQSISNNGRGQKGNSHPTRVDKPLRNDSPRGTIKYEHTTLRNFPTHDVEQLKNDYQKVQQNQQSLPPPKNKVRNDYPARKDNQVGNTKPFSIQNQVERDYPTAPDIPTNIQPVPRQNQLNDYPTGGDNHLRSDYPTGGDSQTRNDYSNAGLSQDIPSIGIPNQIKNDYPTGNDNQLNIFPNGPSQINDYPTGSDNNQLDNTGGNIYTTQSNTPETGTPYNEYNDILVPPIFNTNDFWSEYQNKSFELHYSVTTPSDYHNNFTNHVMNPMDLNSLLSSDVASMGMKVEATAKAMEMAREMMIIKKAKGAKLMKSVSAPTNDDDVEELPLAVAESGYFGLQNGQYTLTTEPDIVKTTKKPYKRPNDEVIPGVAGQDYPIYASPPAGQRTNPCKQGFGYVPDPTTRCQVFYVCTGLGMGEPMLCPNGTLFSRDFLVCDWWYNVECLPN